MKTSKMLSKKKNSGQMPLDDTVVDDDSEPVITVAGMTNIQNARDTKFASFVHRIDYC